MKKHLSFLVLSVILSSACSTVTISPAGKAKLSTEPKYESSKSFFLWGLVGDHDVNVRDVCGPAGASQMQSQHTFVDSLLGIITIGIYSPKTAKVWCNSAPAPKGKKS